MTKQITKAIVLQEMQDKFKMREFDPANFLFDETVVPVYEIGEHFRHHRIKKHTTSISEIGGVTVAIVPSNERWELSRYDVVFVSGAYTVAGAFIRRQVSGYDSVYMDLTAAQSTSYHVSLPVPAILGPGDNLGINVDGFTSPGTLYFYEDAVVEEIR